MTLIIFCLLLYVEHPAEFHLGECQTLFILPDILYGGKWKKTKKYDTKSKVTQL